MTTKLVFIVLVSLYVENRQWEINILSEQPVLLRQPGPDQPNLTEISFLGE